MAKFCLFLSIQHAVQELSTGNLLSRENLQLFLYPYFFLNLIRNWPLLLSFFSNNVLTVFIKVKCHKVTSFCWFSSHTGTAFCFTWLFLWFEVFPDKSFDEKSSFSQKSPKIFLSSIKLSMKLRMYNNSTQMIKYVGNSCDLQL